MTTIPVQTWGHRLPIAFALFDDVDRALLTLHMATTWESAVERQGFTPYGDPPEVRYFDSRIDPSIRQEGLEVLAVVTGRVLTPHANDEGAGPQPEG